MAFGKISKQDLIDAGLDPDKLAEYQAKGVTKDELSAMETKITTSIVDTLKSEMAAMEGRLKPQPVNKGDENGGGENDDTPDEQTEFLTDPVGMINKKVGKLGTAAAVEFKRLSRDLAYDYATSSLPYMKNETIKTEFDEEWKKYTPEMLARNGADPKVVARQVYDMIVGKHHEEITRDTQKGEGKFNVIHSGGSNGGIITSRDSSSNTDNGARKLNDAEKKQASKFGMTEDEWIKQEKDMADEQVSRMAGVGK